MTQPTVPESLVARLQSVLGAGYRVERELGGGGMSRVFLATDETLGRQIIVKVLSQELAEGVSLERFGREIRTLAQLQHPHIVPLLAAGRVDALPYYVMPFVVGESARARLRARGAMPVGELVNVLRDVARALDFAHQHGVVHRDIKPDNILLSGNAAVVSDFGIAKAVSEAREGEAPEMTLTRIGTSIGTPAYMAPEQALADPGIDHRADLYSFGVSAYELLTGTLPFANRTAQAMIKAHVSEPAPNIADQRPDIPRPLATLIMACLEKDPANRPGSAAEVLARLDEVSGTHRIEAGVQPPRRLGRLGLAAAVLVLAIVATFVGLQTRAGRASTLAPAVAVLPFENLSGDTASEYFSDGMTEQLVGDLSRANGLRVASRATTFSYKGKHMDPRDAAAALGVDAVVTGSVRRSGNQLRLEVALVDKKGGSPLWSRRFDRTLDDVFAVQEEVARAITSALKVSLTPTNAAARATDGGTYDLYLQGKHHLSRGLRGRAKLDSAIGLFRAALERDSTYAPAWAALSDAYLLMSEYVAPLAVLPKAKEAAKRAVELDPADESVGLAFASISFNYDWNWPAAEREYRRVLELHPDSRPARRSYANFLGASRRYDEAREQLARAAELEWRQTTDTTGVRVQQLRDRAFLEARSGNTALAFELYRQAIALAPDSWLARWNYGMVVAYSDPAEGVRQLEQVRKITGERLPQLTHVAVAYAIAGRRDSALQILRRLEQRARTEYIPKDQFFTLALALGDRPAAFRWLRQAIEEHHYWLPNLNGHPLADRIRMDSTYRALMRRIGVPESAL